MVPRRLVSCTEHSVKQTVKIAAKFVTTERLKLLFAIPNNILVLTREGM